MLAQGQFGRQLTINEPTRSRGKGESNAHALNVKVKEIQPSVRKYFRSTVKYVITPHTPKTAIIEKKMFFCLTYKNDKPTIK